MPYRKLKRFVIHIFYPVLKAKSDLKIASVGEWISLLPFYILDLFYIPELFVVSNRIFKKSVRALNEEEKILAASIYGGKLNLSKVYIDEKARYFNEKYHMAYVSFNLINHWYPMREAVLIHELMHVYQYYKFGSIYIYKALYVQHHLKNPYDYGGIKGLVKAYQDGKKLYEFNFEQQASIIEHYFVIKNENYSDEVKALYHWYYDQM